MRLEARGVGREVGGRVLFAGLSFALEEGETVALRGPSGAGKTSLLRGLAGLDPLAAGELRLDGRSFEAWGGPAWRAEVAYLVQGGPSLAGAPEATAARVARLRAQRGRAADDPLELASGWGLEPEAWRRPWSALSVGERQRAQLAIVLARRPRVLLLDEPTSALDPAARAAVERSLAGRTALWVTHDEAQAARVATRALELGP